MARRFLQVDQLFQECLVRTLASAASVAVLLTCETCGQWSYCHNSKPSKLVKLEPKTKVKQTTLYKGSRKGGP